MSRLEELIAKLCSNDVSFRPMNEVCTSLKKQTLKQGQLFSSGKYPVINSGRDFYGFYSKYNNEGNAICIASRGEYAGFVTYINRRFWAGGLCYPFRTKNENDVKTKFLFYYLKNREKHIMDVLVARGSIPALNKNDVDKLLIPIPPLPIQEEIVRILDNFAELTTELTTELTKRKEQYSWYRNNILNFNVGFHSNRDDKKIKTIKLGDIGKVLMCKRIMKNETSPVGEVPFYKIGTFGKTPDSYISRKKYEEYKRLYPHPKKGDILISAAGTIGRTVIYDGEDAYFQDSNIVWVDNDESIVLNKYLYYIYQLQPWFISTGGTIKRLYNDNISNTTISIPPLEEQARIVAILDRFDALCNDLTSGLPAEIEARKKQYEYYRDKLLTFKEAVQ